jgi:hypothetical protein
MPIDVVVDGYAIRFLTPKAKMWRRVNVRAEDTHLWSRVPKTKRGLVVRMRPNVEDEIVGRMRADGLIVDAPRVLTEEEKDRYYPLFIQAVTPPPLTPEQRRKRLRVVPKKEDD